MKDKAPARRSRRGLPIIIALLLALAPSHADAAQPVTGANVTVGARDTINDDLYAFGGTVTIDGRVNGDVVAAAGTVTINGVVTGDVIVGGGTITISGRVGGSIRAAGGALYVDAPVGKDVVVAGGNTNLGPGARIGRDLLTVAGSTTIDGRVTRHVRAASGTLRLDRGAVIGGNLIYSSDHAAEIARGATVHGKIERQATQQAWITVNPFGATGIVGWLRTLIGLFLLGLLFVLLAPRYGLRTISTLAGSPWASLGLGFALLICIPVTAALLLIVGLFIGGWWLALILLALYAAALVLSIAVAGLFVGDWIMRRVGRRAVPLSLILLLGLVLLMLIGTVPYIGGGVIGLAMLWGLGALSLTAVRASRAPTPGVAPPTAPVGRFD